MTLNLNVWLVEYPDSFPAANTQEGQMVRNGIRTRLQTWFHRVVRHSNARRAQPRGYQDTVSVAWRTKLTSKDVGDRDLVIHFDASPFVLPNQGANNPSPVLSAYRTAAGQLSNEQLRQQLSGVQRSGSGGRTIVAMVGTDMVPILSIVVVLYDRQFSNLQARVHKNIDEICVISFHEAAHNKDRSNSLHTSGGGGIFADIHTGGLGAATQPNSNNIEFFTDRIWNWGPQYIVGQPLTPVTPP